MSDSATDNQRIDGSAGRRAATGSNAYQWKTLDKDLNRISRVEYATQYVARPLVGLGVEGEAVELPPRGVPGAVLRRGRRQGGVGGEEPPGRSRGSAGARPGSAYPQRRGT